MRLIGAMILAFLTGAASAQSPFATFERASEPVLSDPHDLAIGPDGRLYVADKFGHRIVILDAETLEIQGVIADGQLPNVHDISFAADGTAYVAVTGASAVAIFAWDGSALTFRDAVRPFPGTEGVLAHSSGRYYVMSSATGELLRMEGTDLQAIASGMVGAHDVAEAEDGSIWVADTGNRRLVRFSEDLEELQVIEGSAYGFAGPRYLDIDDFGRLVVADQDAHRVLLIEPASGEVLGIIGDGRPGLGPNRLDDPEGVAVSGNRYYFSDSDNNRIVKYVVVLN